LAGERGGELPPVPEPALSDARAALGEPDLGLDAALNQLAQSGLVGIESFAPSEQQPPVNLQRFRLHPGVAEALLRSAPPAVQSDADAVLGDFFIRVCRHGIDTEMQRGGWVVVEGARHAAPYLLRERRWEAASLLLEEMIVRGPNPATLEAAIPLLRHLVEQTRGSRLELSNMTRLANALLRAGRHAEAEAILRDASARCVAQDNYWQASVAANSLAYLLLDTGRFDEALKTAEELAAYTRQAGLGPWSQLGGEVVRLQVLCARGGYAEVLEAVERHCAQMGELPEHRSAGESHNPWNVREVLLEIGCLAAARLERWEAALEFNTQVLESKRERGADGVEIARTRFNDYAPLLRLRRYGEARARLEECRAAFEGEGMVHMLGRVYTALADLEGTEGRPTSAADFQRTALRYSYQAGRPEDCAINHHNLESYLKRAGGGAQEAALAHLLAGGVIYWQIGSGILSESIDRLARSPLPPAPPSFEQVCEVVERVEGVRFREMFERLPKRAPDGDAAVLAVWEAAKAEAGRQVQEVLSNFEPLLQLVAAGARGDAHGREVVEGLFPELEEKGWHIVEAVRRVWEGERDAEAVAGGLDRDEAALVRRVLELLGGG
jgi:tetratricopeptide (TPR) repeat protein